MNNRTTSRLSLGFTLIELLIAVTISAILFVGVLIFVSSSMRQNIVQEKMLRSLTQKWDFAEMFDRTFSSISSVVWSGSTADGSGILVRTSLPEAPFVLIETKSFTGLCDAYSGSANASSTGYTLSLQAFLPINPDHQTDSSYTISGSGYTISWGGHTIGTGFSGDALTGSGETTELNRASALVKHGNMLYIADTLNHRILAYEPNIKNISELLWKEGGISLPIDLTMSGNSLLIANAGNGEILSVQDSFWSDTQFSQTFKVSTPFSFDRITFEADSGSTLGGPTDTGSYTFSGFIPQSSDVATSNPLTYAFSWGSALTAATGTTYWISISGISGAPSGTGPHSMRLSFFSGATLVYQDSLPWYTIGDHALETTTGNVLQVVADNLEFPHHLSSSTWSGEITNLSDFNDTSPLQTFSSSVPITDLSYGIVNNVLTLSWREYAYYDCLTEKHLIHERVYKQLLQ